MRYDADGDGTFELSVTPTVSASGFDAADTEAPTIAFSERVQGNRRVVTLTAQDGGTGVKSIFYSLDGTTFQLYTSALTIDPTANPTIYAFADDNVANRSSRVTYKPLTITTVVTRDSITKEIIVAATIRNEGTATVTINLILTAVKLNNKPTTTPLPLTINEVGASGSVSQVLRFPATATTSNSRATLSGIGTSHGQAFSGAVQVTIP